MFFTSQREREILRRCRSPYPRNVVINVNAFQDCRVVVNVTYARTHSRLGSSQLQLHPAQVILSENRSRNFGFIVPLLQLAAATGPSLAINRLRASSSFLGESLIKTGTYSESLSLSFYLSPSVSPLPPGLMSLLFYPTLLVSLTLFRRIHATTLYLCCCLVLTIRQHIAVITSFAETTGLLLCNSKLARNLAALIKKQ